MRHLETGYSLLIYDIVKNENVFEGCNFAM
jgi:hypothetical protein